MTPTPADTTRPPRPTHRLPSCYSLLDQRVRLGLWLYRWMGSPTCPIEQAIAYIEILEDELARREAAEA